MKGQVMDRKTNNTKEETVVRLYLGELHANRFTG